MYNILAKIYFARGNKLLADFDYKNEANKKIHLSAIATEKQMEITKAYIKKGDLEFFEDISKESLYIMSMNKLSRTKEKSVISKQLEKMPNIIKDRFSHTLIKALIEARFKNYDDAKKHYKKALKKNPENVIVLRGLGLIEFGEKNYQDAYEHLSQLEKITPYYLFNNYSYDVLIQQFLIKLCIRKLKIFKAISHTHKYFLYKKNNKKILKEKYLL